jgi:hypothetical protein
MSGQSKVVTRARRRQTAITGWAIGFVSIALSLSGCSGGGGGGDGSSSSSVGSEGCTLSIQELQAIGNINDIPQACLSMLPVPEDNLLGRMFVLGTQKDNGDLHIFVTGTDNDGNPLQLTDFQSATVSIDGHPVDPGLVSVDPIAAGDYVLSLGFVTDYSTSISDAELAKVADIYSIILDSLSPPNLPQMSLPGSLPVLKGMVINFSDLVVVKQDWTDDPALLQAAYQLDPSFSRKKTRLYDALDVALQGDPGQNYVGLVEQCTPAHMLITFTDGADNASFTGATKETLLPIIDRSKTVMIMLGSLSADKPTLMDLAGDQGAFVYAYNLSGIESTVQKWADSLSQMVKFTLDPATGFDTGTITITLGEYTVTVERPVDGFCEI